MKLPFSAGLNLREPSLAHDWIDIGNTVVFAEYHAAEQDMIACRLQTLSVHLIACRSFSFTKTERNGKRMDIYLHEEVHAADRVPERQAEALHDGDHARALLKGDQAPRKRNLRTRTRILTKDAIERLQVSTRLPASL
jgi:hypothetical protein